MKLNHNLKNIFFKFNLKRKNKKDYLFEPKQKVQASAKLQFCLKLGQKLKFLMKRKTWDKTYVLVKERQKKNRKKEKK